MSNNQQAASLHPTHQSAANSAGGRVATKAGAYGGSEVGSLVGGMVGPPIIGSIVGNLVGERVGEHVTKDVGLDKAAGEMSDNLGRVIGRQNVDKMGQITLTALGYSKSEECVCCPCLPASQILLVIMIGFFSFNWYRLGVGIDSELYCTEGLNDTTVLTVSNEDIVGNDSLKNYFVIDVNSQLNETTYMVAYPCEFGFHYLVTGATVWLIFLPFYICSLFGNCWRQCCCCLCDPVVCCATISDLIKRFCCECGRFSIVDLVWYGMCSFQVIWAILALHWLIVTKFFGSDDYKFWDNHGNVLKTVFASLILDLILAGSEIFHKVRLHFQHESRVEDCREEYELQQLPAGTAGNYYAA